LRVHGADDEILYHSVHSRNFNVLIINNSHVRVFVRLSNR